jgi:hypothetical protein
VRQGLHDKGIVSSLYLNVNLPLQVAHPRLLVVKVYLGDEHLIRPWQLLRLVPA